MLIRVAVGVFLLWSTVAVAVALAAFTLTLRGNLREQGTPAPTMVAPTQTPRASRPAGVPAGARPVSTDTTLGDVSAHPPGAPHIFYALSCHDHLLTVATTQETIYAATDCSKYWLPEDAVRPFLSQPVRVRISAGPPAVIVVDSIAAGAARFSADAVWLEVR